MEYTPTTFNVRADILERLRTVANRSEYLNNTLAKVLGLPEETTRDRSKLRFIEIDLMFHVATKLMHHQNATRLSKNTILDRALRAYLHLPPPIHTSSIRRTISNQNTHHEMWVSQEVFDALLNATRVPKPRHHNLVVEAALDAYFKTFEELV